MLSSDIVFRENCRSESRTLFTDINEFLSSRSKFLFDMSENSFK